MNNTTSENPENSNKTLHTCYACSTKLTPVFDEETTYQFDNALWLGFLGGYGMFTDNIRANHTLGEGRKGAGLNDPDYRVVICGNCATKLCDKVPWIKELLK